MNYSLWINVASMTVCVFQLFKAYKLNNMIAICYWVTFIFLVVGQGINISMDLSDKFVTQYLNNFITQEGNFWASVIVFLIVVVIALMNSNAKKAEITESEQKLYTFKSYKMGYHYLMLLIFCVLVISILKIIGVQNFFVNSRFNNSGTTFFLVGLGSLTYPLLIKMAKGFKIKMMDQILYFVSIYTILSFSRILAISHLLVLLIVYIYKGKKDLKKYKKQMFFAFICGIFVFFIYGAYRDALPKMPEGSGFMDAMAFSLNNPNSLFSLDFNYHVGIEGMSGLSGIMSQYLSHPNFQPNFGISTLSALFKLIPSVARGPFNNIADSIHSSYWYHGSIVAGGLEGYFVHFSWLMLLLYPLSFYWFAFKLHPKLVKAAADPDVNILKYAIIAAIGLQIIRGSTDTIVFFMISELIVYKLSVFIFHLFYNGVEERKSNQFKTKRYIKQNLQSNL